MWGLLVLLLALSPARPAAAAISWQWERAPDLFPRLDLTAGPYAVALKKKKTLILRGPSWSVRIAEGSDESGAALATDGVHVFVAFYRQITSGCQLAGFDGASGKRLWSVWLEGVGPVAHSAYFNRVQMRLIGGHPTVFGLEARARYIEQRDAANGALVSHQRLPAERPPMVIGEWLFRELDIMLRTRPSYTVRVNDFLARHMMMKNADHAARGAAFTEAVHQLDRLGLFEIRLVDTGDDFELTAKRLGK
jgi:hypothetical protein